ncbi:hypothetical protein PACTADRAFT_47552 [Pachysolen tannophilus NRRL Y-2460]|uniref:Rrp15p-domain-containing protein n=1 Tax=Pachysolen tannophilus NRRL Y-2460 TaxID=669874 RepID=A0A1E4U109_PACTA|nr:hypothetical protein PACTADRAFT_47552 [Pachysolen tannophilus NRRL Y-2460]
MVKLESAPKRQKLDLSGEVELSKNDSKTRNSKDLKSDEEDEEDEEKSNLDQDDDLSESKDESDVASSLGEDEPDLEDVSSDESLGSGSSNSDSDSDSDDYSTKKKSKPKGDDNSESFSNAFNAIINSKLKSYNRKDPILVRSKSKLQKFQDEKLEQKAKRALLAEKNAQLNKDRIKDIYQINAGGNDDGNDGEQVKKIMQREKFFKKTAQRGVIRLFNAILLTQTSTIKELETEEKEKGKVGKIAEKELLNEISKEKFMDLIQAAGRKS